MTINLLSKQIGLSFCPCTVPAPTVSPSNVVVQKTGDTYVDLMWDFPKDEIGKPQTRIKGEFRGFKVLLDRLSPLPPDFLKMLSQINLFTYRVLHA